MDSKLFFKRFVMRTKADEEHKIHSEKFSSCWILVENFMYECDDEKGQKHVLICFVECFQCKNWDIFTSFEWLWVSQDRAEKVRKLRFKHFYFIFFAVCCALKPCLQRGENGICIRNEARWECAAIFLACNWTIYTSTKMWSADWLWTYEYMGENINVRWKNECWIVVWIVEYTARVKLNSLSKW